MTPSRPSTLSLFSRGELYGPLRDVVVFNRARLDPEARTLVWPNRADFEPTTLHDWPECKQEMREMALRWASIEA